MAFMDKNVNFILITLIIVILLSLVGATAYFQKNIKDISDRFHSKEQHIEKLEQQIMLLENISQQLNSSIVSKSTDYNTLSNMYLVEKDSKQKLNSSLISTKKDLASTKEQLDNAKTELSSTTKKYNAALNDVTELNGTLKSYQTYIQSARSNINQLKNIINGYLEQNLTECIGYFEEIDDEVDDLENDIEGLEDV